MDRHAVPVPGEGQLEPALDVRRGQRVGDRRALVAVEHLPDLAGQRPRRRVVEGALALLPGEIGQRSVVEGVGRAPGDLEGAMHEQATQRRQAVAAPRTAAGRSAGGRSAVTGVLARSGITRGRSSSGGT